MFANFFHLDSYLIHSAIALLVFQVRIQGNLGCGL